MISYFNITINISIITDPSFNRFLKISIIFLSHHKFFVKMFFIHFTAVLGLFDDTINKIVNSISPEYDLTGLLNLFQQIVIYSHNCKQYVFDI